MDEKPKRKEKPKRAARQRYRLLTVLGLIGLGLFGFAYYRVSAPVEDLPTPACYFSMMTGTQQQINQQWTEALQQRLEQASLSFHNAMVQDEAFEFEVCDDGTSTPLFASCWWIEVTIPVSALDDVGNLGNTIGEVLRALGEEPVCGSSHGQNFRVIFDSPDGALRWEVSGYYALMQAYHHEGLRGEVLYQLGTVR
jgi:hypothetical protein